LGPRPSVGAGARVVWAPGSRDGPPEAAEAVVSSDASGAVSSRQRPGTRSLMSSITTQKREPDRAETITAIKS
jgi:hypothetical protein